MRHRAHNPEQSYTTKGTLVKTVIATLGLTALVAAAPLCAQTWSWDPLQAVESVLPEGVPNESKIIQARHQVREMAQDSLATLYEIAPGTKRAIEQSAGYAVFSTFGVKLFFAGGTSGKGVVVNKRTTRHTFMKMLQVQGGLGFGLSKARLIFVFANERALRTFIDQGWEFGAQANVAAMAQGAGGMFAGAAAISPGVYVYQITDTGLAATLTVAGTRFFKDADMN
jgi:lipid-binding SYLF domain-containing protein